MELTAVHISKSIQGQKVLDDVSIRMVSGKVYGFCGRNGSGKTMLFRALSGLIRLDEGTVRLDGKLLHKDFSVLPNLGIVLENAGLYMNMTGMQNLMFLAGLNKKVGEKEAYRAMERVGLEPEDKRSYRKYSMGMKQRLAIAQAIMEEPDILMLDEPTNGLDDEGVKLIRKIILEEKRRGALILFASHIKEDVHILADQLYYVSYGKVLFECGVLEAGR